jgi:molecular chaperone DnaK
MKAEAEANADSDRIEKEKVEKLNQADNMIFQTEKQIKEFDEKLTEDDKTELNSILNDLRTAHKDQDTIKIDSEMEKLNESWNRISTNLYSQASQDPQPDSGQPQAEDVNFEEVK